MRETNKPIFANDDNLTDTYHDDDNALYASSSDSDVVTADEIRETFKITGKLLGSFLVAAIVATIVLYSVASATVGTLIHLDNKRFVWTERDAWAGGNPEIGDNVTALMGKSSADNFFGKMAEGFDVKESASVFVIVAGPYGRIDVDEKNNISYQDKSLNITGDVRSRTLDKEFLAKCFDGDCKEGAYYYVPSSYIIGKANQYLGE